MKSYYFFAKLVFVLQLSFIPDLFPSSTLAAESLTSPIYSELNAGKGLPNFFAKAQKGKKLHSDIDSGHKSTLLVQLGNISQRVGRSLEINPQNGHILKDKEAKKLWSRE